MKRRKRGKGAAAWTVGLILGIVGVVAAAARAQDAVIEVHADKALHGVSRHLTGACIEDVNHEIYGGLYSQMIFGESFQEDEGEGRNITGPWKVLARGQEGSDGKFELVRKQPFLGRQSLRVELTGDQGEAGIENAGLNEWGMNLERGKPYEGCVWARAEKPTKFYAALETEDGKVRAEKALETKGGEWEKLDFVLTPRKGTTHGRFALILRRSGAVTFGYAFLQPGAWGRFNGLPVRRDVAEGMMSQGITVLRYGGSMVNAPEYRWKRMIGPRGRRTPYHGTWYPHSSNGWGIIDFLNFCEAAGFLGVPAFNIDETPEDMADFVEYVNGPANTEWGARRAADGHPAPYGLKILELGNEERVDATYAEKFEALATAIWGKDKEIVPVVGDFGYQKKIEDPFHFSGADSRITSLAGQQEILKFAKAHGQEIRFDVHVWTDGPRPTSSLEGAFSFRDALEQIADGARFSVVIFELNADNPTQKRALANALAIMACEKDGRIPIVTSANGLQPDGQNDNGWNQGLLFLNPWETWLQPPGFVTQMFSRSYEPEEAGCEATGAGEDLAAEAARSADGGELVLRVVNTRNEPVRAALKIEGFAPRKPRAAVEELAGPKSAHNDVYDTHRIEPRWFDWTHELKDGQGWYVFPGNSMTVMKFE